MFPDEQRCRSADKADILTAICEAIAVRTLLAFMALLFYMKDDVRTSQEAHLLASTACYGDNSLFLYVDDVHTSQETQLWVTTACYRDSYMPFTY
jgi:hypothetical protein